MDILSEQRQPLIISHCLGPETVVAKWEVCQFWGREATADPSLRCASFRMTPRWENMNRAEFEPAGAWSAARKLPCGKHSVGEPQNHKNLSVIFNALILSSLRRYRDVGRPGLRFVVPTARLRSSHPCRKKRGKDGAPAVRAKRAGRDCPPRTGSGQRRGLSCVIGRYHAHPRSTRSGVNIAAKPAPATSFGRRNGKAGNPGDGFPLPEGERGSDHARMRQT